MLRKFSIRYTNFGIVFRIFSTLYDHIFLTINLKTVVLSQINAKKRIGQRQVKTNREVKYVFQFE